MAHGTFQGGMSAIQGGKFWSGFASGALSSIAASAFGKGFNHEGIDANGKMIKPTQVWGGAGKFASSGAGMIAFGTVSGGAGAALTGGNFWQGAVTGLVVSGLNHFAHKLYERNLIRSSLKDPNGVPELSENSVKNIKKEVYALFTDDMKKNESLPKIKVGGSNGTKNGDFEYRMDEDGSANGGTVIKFYKSAFKSNYILARTILHEYYHAGDFYSGNAGMKMWSLRYKLNLKGNELQNAYTDYFERGAFNYVRGLGAYQDKNYYYNQKLYHR